MQGRSTENTIYSSLGIVHCASRIPSGVVSHLSEFLSIYVQQRAGVVPHLISVGSLENQVTGQRLSRTELTKYSAMTVFIGYTYPQRTIQLMQSLLVLSQVHSRAWKFGGRDQFGYVVESYRHNRN